MSNPVWNPDNITDVAESVGVGALNHDVVTQLAQDVEYRVSQILEEALKFMRNAKRTTLSTQDISQALRLLDVEPLYGYEATRPLRFGEASIGPGQPLYYVEDEEIDFEKFINAPLPKVPREISLTGLLFKVYSAYTPTDTVCSTLARRRRRTTLNPSKPYICRSETPRASSKRSWRQPEPGCHRRKRQRRRQASGQARHFKRTTTILRTYLQCHPGRDQRRVPHLGLCQFADRSWPPSTGTILCPVRG